MSGALLPMQAWRRIDWRFLLPTLDLGRVLCLDGGDASLPAAIRLAGGTVSGLSVSGLSVSGLSVSGLSASRQGGVDGAPPEPVVFDGAALVAPSPAELAAAVRAVRPGGWVYAEVRRHLRAAHPGPRSLGDCRRRFDRAGLRHIETFWHAPDFATCTRIVPLASTAAVRNALGRHHAERFGAAKSLAGRAALATGLFALAVPEGSVLGRRPVAGRTGAVTGAPGPPVTFVDQLLHARRDELGLAAHGIGDRLTTVLITPGYATSRHVVGLVFEHGHPDPRLVVKIPVGPGDNGGVRREAAVLRELAERSGGVAAGVPAVLGCPDVGPYSVLVETAVAGAELGPGLVAADRDAAVRAGARFVLQLPVTRPAAGNDGWYEATVSGPLAVLVSLAPLGGRTAALSRQTEDLLAPLRTARLPAVFEHADLSHPNLFQLPDATLGVIDWERATSRGVPGHDLVFFLQYLAESAASAFTIAAQLRAFDDAFLDPGGWALPVLTEHLRARGVDPALAPLLVVATWARSAATLASRLVPDGAAGRDGTDGTSGTDGTGAVTGHPSADQLAATVLADRDFALWQHALTVCGAHAV